MMPKRTDGQEIVVEFLDGPLEDYLIFADENGAAFESVMASGIFTLTDGGTVGRVFQVPSFVGMQSLRSTGKTDGSEADLHWYEVKYRSESENCVKLQATHIPKPPPLARGGNP
jgi:hypothetical protein